MEVDYALFSWSPSFISWSSWFPWSPFLWSSSPVSRVIGASVEDRSSDVMCKKPYREGVAEYGCGQCLPCRMNRRRLWTSRLMLEQRLHAASCFITLTYSKEHLPRDNSVHPSVLQGFMKRLRRRLEPVHVRYYGVGEYGTDHGRPHYHLALFGHGYLGHIQPGEEKYLGKCKCEVCASWDMGGVTIYELNEKTAAYICKYVTKSKGEEDGRYPEFARMSLRPGIGAGAAPVIVEGVARGVGWDVYLGRSDEGVPSAVRRNKKMWPLGRYIRRKVRASLGLGEGESRRVLDGIGRKMQDELCVPGAREAREGKREQVAKRAKVLDEISRSKKGLP